MLAKCTESHITVRPLLAQTLTPMHDDSRTFSSLTKEAPNNSSLPSFHSIHNSFLRWIEQESAFTSPFVSSNITSDFPVIPASSHSKFPFCYLQIALGRTNNHCLLWPFTTSPSLRQDNISSFVTKLCSRIAPILRQLYYFSLELLTCPIPWKQVMIFPISKHDDRSDSMTAVITRLHLDKVWRLAYLHDHKSCIGWLISSRSSHHAWNVNG